MWRPAARRPRRAGRPAAAPATPRCRRASRRPRSTRTTASRPARSSAGPGGRRRSARAHGRPSRAPSAASGRARPAGRAARCRCGRSPRSGSRTAPRPGTPRSVPAGMTWVSAAGGSTSWLRAPDTAKRRRSAWPTPPAMTAPAPMAVAASRKLRRSVPTGVARGPSRRCLTARPRRRPSPGRQPLSQASEQPATAAPIRDGSALAALALTWSSEASAPTSPMSADADQRGPEPALGQPAEPHRQQHQDDQRADDQHELVVRREGPDGPVLDPSGDVVDRPLPHGHDRALAVAPQARDQLRHAQARGQGDQPGDGAVPPERRVPGGSGGLTTAFTAPMVAPRRPRYGSAAPRSVVARPVFRDR